MVYIYALILEHGKYYIGKTNNPRFRFETHFNSNGSEWTKLHKPLNIVEVIPDCDDYDEDKYTIQYMNKYGINNVRGGSFATITLAPQTINIINQMCHGANNRCFACGIVGHFAKNCKNVKKDKKKKQENKEPCNCPTSYFSPHRKFRCFINNIILNDDSDTDNSDTDNDYNISDTSDSD